MLPTILLSVGSLCWWHLYHSMLYIDNIDHMKKTTLSLSPLLLDDQSAYLVLGFDMWVRVRQYSWSIARVF